MDLRQLEFFVAVVEEGSFTRAARRLLVAQPSVSTRIRQLERELGQPLLDRTQRTVRVTELGAAVLPHARAALDAVDGARRVVDEVTGLVRGQLTLGAVAEPSAVDLPGLLASFRNRHAGVGVALTVGDTDDLVAGLRAGRLDVAFGGLWATTPPDLAVQVLADEAVVAAVAPDDPLAGQDTVTLAELVDRDLICLPAGTGQRASVDHAFAAAGLRPTITLEASTPHVLAGFAARRLGVAFLPESVAVAERHRLHLLRLPAPTTRVWFGAIWRHPAPTNPAARALIAHLRRVATAPSA